MLGYDEKRDTIRTDVDCDITYKLADSATEKTGRCTSLSGAGISFIAEHAYDTGLAMIIKIFPQNSTTASMTAFIEVVRCVPQKNDAFEIAAAIRSLK